LPCGLLNHTSRIQHSTLRSILSSLVLLSCLSLRGQTQ
jgi:hypothetical protein